MADTIRTDVNILLEFAPMFRTLRDIGDLADTHVPGPNEDAWVREALAPFGPPYGTRYGKARTTPKLPRKLKKRLDRRFQSLGYKQFGPMVISGTFDQLE